MSYPSTTPNQTAVQSVSHLASAACLLGVLSLPAVVNAATIDLTGIGNGDNPGHGNSLSFSADGIAVEVSAYAETGATIPENSAFYAFETAEVYSWDQGLGVCNRFEGVVGDGCINGEHELDTVGRDDLLVFEFDQTVAFDSITVDPFDGPGDDANDRDIIYWLGQTDALPDLTLESFFSLGSLAGFGTETHLPASRSFAPFTHGLSGTGNVLLLSGNYHSLGCGVLCEEYKVSAISVSAVPIPAAFWLFATALLGLGRYRRNA